MSFNPDKYIPSEKELEKAEAMLTDAQRYQSEKRARELTNSQKEEKNEQSLRNKMIELEISTSNSGEQVQEIIKALKKAKLYRKGALYRGAHRDELLKKYKNPKEAIWASTEKEFLDPYGEHPNAYRYTEESDNILIVFDGNQFIETRKISIETPFSYTLKPNHSYDTAIIAIIKIHYSERITP